MQKLTLILILATFFSSCANEKKTKKVVVKNLYSIELPSFLSENNNLNASASLQYMNIFKEFYVIVIDEPKELVHNSLMENSLTDTYSSDINGYSKLILDNYEQTIDILQKSSVRDTIINHLNARLFSMTGISNGVDAFFALAFIEGRENYYQIMTWTLSGKENKHLTSMNKLIGSFKET